MRILALVLAAAACAGSAMAGDQEVVTSSTHKPLPAAAATTTPVTVAATDTASTKLDQDQTIAWLGSRSAVADKPVADTPKAESLVHGSAGVSVGTGGYRSAYATAVMPVGDSGMLGIAVSHTDYGKNALPYYGYGYGRDYGRGGWDGYARGGHADSFGLSYMNVGDDDRGPSAPDGCAPGFRDRDGRYVEPVWVTQLNGGKTCEAGVTP